MTLSGYRFGIRLFTLFGLLTLLVFIFVLDPGSLSQWGIIFFFVNLWVLSVGVFSLLLLFLYRRFLGEESAAYFISTLLRQSLLLGTYALSVAALLYFHVFVWWNATLLFIFFLLLELTLRRFSRASE